MLWINYCTTECWDEINPKSENQMSRLQILPTNRLAVHLISFVPLCFVENVSAKTSWTALESVFVCEHGQGVASDSSAPPEALLSHREYAFVLQRHTAELDNLRGKENTRLCRNRGRCDMTPIYSQDLVTSPSPKKAPFTTWAASKTPSSSFLYSKCL